MNTIEMNVDEAFEKYPNNILGFRKNNNTKIIDFWFNYGWDFPERNDEDLLEYTIKKQKEAAEGQPTYHIIYSETLDFKKLYEHISKIIDYNLDIEKKRDLFSEKIDALKKLFITLTYDELKAITFDTTQQSEEIIKPE